MSVRRAGGVFLVLLCSVGIAQPCADSGVIHQAYTATVSETVQAIRLALEDLGRGVLGADDSAGLVVSTAKRVKRSEVAELVEFDEDVEIMSMFVVLVTPRGPDASQVEVMTVLRGRTPEKGFVGGGVYLSPSPLSDPLYAALAPYLGKGRFRARE